MEPKNILGLSFSTRLIGFAVFSHGNLIEYSIRLYKESFTPLKCSKIKQTLQTCIEDYNIGDIVLSIPPHHFQSDGFNEIRDCIESLAKEMNCVVSYHSHKMLLSLCIPKEKKNKIGFQKSIVYYFPEIEYLYRKEKRNKKCYYIKMFEAIGVAYIEHTLLEMKRFKQEG
jgi:RNase H-fold protein (predicted Holliday junction resolvase)